MRPSLGVEIPQELRVRMSPAKLVVGGADDVVAKIGFAIWGDPDWRQYFYVTWDEDTRDQGTLSISVGLKFLRDSQAIVSAKAKLKTTKPPYEVGADSKEVYMWRTIAATDIVTLGPAMRELIRTWADSWKHAGGLKPFLTAGGQ